MLKLAVLGLLQREAMNGYRVKQSLNTFMSCSICVNYGAIYPLLKRMEDQGEVMLCTEPQEASHGGKVYSITPVGKTNWRQEMLAHPQESWVNARSRFMIKFFFFSDLSSQERIELIDYRLISCRLRLAEKKALSFTSDVFQATLQKRAIAMIESEIDWLVELLEIENSLVIPNYR